MESAIWEKLEAKYKPLVIAFAEEIRKEIAENSEAWSVSEVSDFTDEDLSVFFLIKREGHEPIDCTFRLLDAYAWDGTKSGTSFALDVVSEGGRIVGGCHPYNYSDKVWVDPTIEEDVETRWQEFKGAVDAVSIMYSIDMFEETAL